MKRRAFLGFLGGAAVAGPAAAKSAGEMALSDLTLGSAAQYANAVSATTAGLYPGNDRSWEKEQLKRLVGKTAEQASYERQRHMISALDPCVGTLRSVALHRKIEMSRILSYDREQRKERTWLEACISGLFS